MKKLIWLCLIILITACGKPTKNTSNDAKSTVDASSEEPSQEVAAKTDTAFEAGLEVSPLPNSDTVLLHWNASAFPGASWKVARQPSLSFKEITVTSGELRDPSVVSGESYHYQLFLLKDEAPLLMGEATIKLPRDLEITGVLERNSIVGVRRLFLQEGATLLFFNKPLNIDVAEIISNGGRIASFPSDLAAALGQPGRSAGDITIKAQRANGRLIVESRGENGGAGAAGAPGPNGAKGRNGRPAELTAAPFVKGNLRALSACKSPPSDGEKGEMGFPGLPGLAGSSGGNSGRIFVQVKNSENFRIKPLALPGQGGAGGAGGLGGAGGPGGDAGTRDEFNICPAAHNGLPGIPGTNGAPGPRGANGATQPLCLKLGSSTYGDCETFSGGKR